MGWGRVRLLDVGVDEALDVKLAEDEPLSRPVEAEEPFVLVDLAFRALLLRRILAPVHGANELRSQGAGMLAADDAPARLASPVPSHFPIANPSRSSGSGAPGCCAFTLDVVSSSTATTLISEHRVFIPPVLSLWLRIIGSVHPPAAHRLDPHELRRPGIAIAAACGGPPSPPPAW